MIPKTIERLGKRKYAARISPKAAAEKNTAPIVGFDTEYDSATKELLSLQFWTGGTGALVEILPGGRMTKPVLYDALAAWYDPMPEEVWLITYFSAAELQHIDTIHQADDHHEYAVGFMDCTLEHNGCSMRVFDLSRWFVGASLAKVAESYGMKKLAWDRSQVSRADLARPAFREYALHDARLCHDIFIRLSRDFGTVGADILASKTAPGAAATVFRSRLPEPLYLAGGARRDQALRSYWGGRAEVFARGRFPALAEYDLKSAYPSAAISIHTFPTRRDWHMITRAADMADWRGGICTVDFKYPARCQYPGLPVVAADGKTLYPLSGRSHCTFDEAVIALEHGAEVAIVDAYAYDNGSPALGEYMQWAVDNRAVAGKGPVGTMWKLLANSLIGKFCQKVDKYHIGDIMKAAAAHGMDPADALAMDPESRAALLGIEKKISIGPVWAPEWAGLIMGRVRAELAAAMPASAPVYCHTDSIWTAGRVPAGRWLTWEKKGTGPAVVIRSRLGGIWYDGTAPHVAHHAIWDGRLAEALLYYWTPDAPPELKYTIEKPARMVAAARRGVNPGTWIKYSMTASTAWDQKRILNYDGTTRPWPSAFDYNLACKMAAEKDSLFDQVETPIYDYMMQYGFRLGNPNALGIDARGLLLESGCKYRRLYKKGAGRHADLMARTMLEDGLIYCPDGDMPGDHFAVALEKEIRSFRRGPDLPPEPDA